MKYMYILFYIVYNPYLFEMNYPKTNAKMISVTNKHPPFCCWDGTFRDAQQRSLLIPLCPVAKEGHDNYGKICVFEWIIVEWWINKRTPFEDWFSGNDTPESLTLKDSTAKQRREKGYSLHPRQAAKMASYL